MFYTRCYVALIIMKQKIEHLEDFGIKGIVHRLQQIVEEGGTIIQVLDCGKFNWIIIYNAT